MQRMGNFGVGRESRDNHPGNSKAVLYQFQEGKPYKIGVWKPGKSEPKLGAKDIPNDVFEAFRKECLAIEAEEKSSGIADY